MACQKCRRYEIHLFGSKLQFSCCSSCFQGTYHISGKCTFVEARTKALYKCSFCELFKMVVILTRHDFSLAEAPKAAQQQKLF